MISYDTTIFEKDLQSLGIQLEQHQIEQFTRTISLYLLGSKLVYTIVLL